jgi:hypothetical protein
VRRIESSMLLVWDSRVLCQPHRGQLGRSGSVTASTSPFPQCRLPACPVLRIQIAVPGLCPFSSSNLRGHQTCKVTNLPSMVTFGGLITSRNLWHFTPVLSSETACPLVSDRGTAGWSAVSSAALSSVAAHGNWQDAVADVPVALDSFTVAETSVDAATWLAMGCV